MSTDRTAWEILGEELKKLRTNLGLDLCDAAVMVGIHPENLEDMEAGKFLASKEVLKKLRTLYHLPAREGHPTVVCAYCQAVTEGEINIGELVSHGVCVACVTDILKNLKPTTAVIASSVAAAAMEDK
jgi:transcriptional regulator with XRE-family HTH domain